MQKKSFDKIQLSFIINTLGKLGVERTCLNIVKTIYDKHTTHIILNGEMLEIFSLISGKWQECPFLPLLFNILLKALPRADRQGTKLKGIQIENTEEKLLVNDKILQKCTKCTSFYYALLLFADITFLQLESLWQPCTEQDYWHYFSNCFCSLFVSATFCCLLSLFSHVWLCVTLWTIACQAPLSMRFSK